jgi:hypothetical protein
MSGSAGSSSTGGDEGERARARTRRLRRDILLGAAVLLVLFLAFRHRDTAGNAPSTPSLIPATSTPSR